jgi:hypothetical protein
VPDEAANHVGLETPEARFAARTEDLRDPHAGLALDGRIEVDEGAAELARDSSTSAAFCRVISSRLPTAAAISRRPWLCSLLLWAMARSRSDTCPTLPTTACRAEPVCCTRCTVVSTSSRERAMRPRISLMRAGLVCSASSAPTVCS